MEIKRVLAPSGVVSITEIDWGTLVVQSSDNELGRRFSDLACRELRNGLIIRELPGHLRELGFNHILIAPEVEVAQDLDTFYTWFVEPSLKHFKGIGAFSEADADAFLTDLGHVRLGAAISLLALTTQFSHRNRAESHVTHAGPDGRFDTWRSV